MKKGFQYLILFILLIFTISTKGQNNDPCGCDKALPDGLRDEINSIYNINLDSSLSLIYSRSFNYWENGEWKKDQSMQSGGQAYSDLFSGFLNGNQNESQKHEQFTRDSTNFQITKHLSFSQYQYLSQKTASLTAYTAWSKCKHDCTELLKDGQVLVTKSNIIPGEVRVDIFLKRGEHTNTPIKIMQINAPHIKMLNGNLKQGKTMKWGETYSSTYKLENLMQEAAIKINLSDNWSTDEVIIPSIDNTIGSKKSLLDTIVHITNGSLNVNSRMGTSWGTIAADPVNLWFNVPVNDSSRTYDAAWLTTKAAVNSNSSENFYTWSLSIENHYGAKTRPDGIGRGWATVNPEYTTYINLPQLENYKDLFYSIVVKCDMQVDYPYSPSDPNRGKIEISGKDNFYQFLSVKMDSIASAILSVDSVQPGLYKLEMQGYRVGVNAGQFDVPSPFNIFQKYEGSYKIKLIANITTHGVKVQPPPPKPIPSKNYLISYLIAAILVVGLIVLFILKRKRN
jgi:hypothetical protein